MTPPAILGEFSGLEHLACGTIICNTEGVIRYINPSAEAILEISHDQACKKNIDLFFQDKNFFQQLKKDMRQQIVFRENEYFIKTKNNKTVCSTLIASFITASKNILIELLPMDQHLKVTKEERMIIQQQANAELLRNLAHEIRNPLGGLRGAAQLLEQELKDKNLTEYTQIIIAEADRLQNLMNRLLSPYHLPKYELTNIHELIERVRGLTISEFGHEIEIIRDYDVSLPEIIADREKLIQALLNITRNACQALKKYDQETKQISIKTRSDRHMCVHQKKYLTVIRVDIIDNGPGIAKNILDKIFYPLVSGNQDGAGLGLSLAQDFISIHKGMIEAHSKRNKTCFSIILPIKNDLTSSEGEIHG